MIRLIPIILLMILGVGALVYQPKILTGTSITPTPTIGEIIPSKLQIPKIGIDAHVEQVGLAADGRMDVPILVENVAWYNLGAKPGQVGSAVIAGHFDTPTGTPGVFYDLNKLQAGDIIETRNEDEKLLQFVVENIQTYSDATFPLELVFAQSDKPRLNLITCDGVFDPLKRNYSDRLVVFAVLLH